MSFAAAEARVNASVIARLANATAIVVLPADAAGTTVDGIFDMPDLSVDLGPGLESAAPQFSAKDSDLPDAVIAAIASGDDISIEVRGCTYRVVDPKPDGTGFTVLRLRK